MFSSAWRFRHFISSSIRADIQSRFSHSRVAGLWLLVQPIVQVAIFATILSSVLMAKLPSIDNKFAYVVFLLSGVLAWGLFQEIVSRSLTVFIDSANLLKKIAFPRVTLPLIIVGGALVNYGLLLSAVTVFVIVIGLFPGLPFVSLLPLTALLICLACGLGLILGVLNVFMRDVGQAASIVLNLWFWLTPIVYPLNIVPPELARYFHYNPLFPIIRSFQRLFLEGAWPAWGSLAWVAALSFALLAVALVLFRRAGPEMVDVL
jgi:lipopolysaccharide transport system permease protein